MQQNANRTDLAYWSVFLSACCKSRAAGPVMFKLAMNDCQWGPHCFHRIKAFTRARKFQNAKVQRTHVVLQCDSIRMFTFSIYLKFKIINP